MTLVVEPGALNETGTCPCCGQVSRTLQGYILEDDATSAAYFVHWTVGHFPELNANIDLILGRWGDQARASDRVAVSLELAVIDGVHQVMVIDASGVTAESDLVGRALRREEVIGTLRAKQVFDLIDAIFEQEARLEQLHQP